jgi:hypothetical protein
MIPTLEDTLMSKCQPTQTFLPVKEIGKHIPKVASSSMSPMTLIEEFLVSKFSKIPTP